MEHHHQQHRAMPGSSPTRTPRFPPTFPFQHMLEQMHQQQQQQEMQQQQQQQASEDDESSPNRSSSGGGSGQQIQLRQMELDASKQQQQQGQQTQQRGGGGGGSGSGEVVARKPRGRPPGSKNKPKPPIIITRDSGAGMRPHVLEVAPGNDIVDAIAGYARRKQRGICVLSGKGSVTNVTLLRHHHRPSSPSSASSSASPPASTVSYSGRFELLSMSGAFLQQMPSAGIALAFSGLAVSVAGGPQGQVIGGTVAGPLIAATPVIVIAASFVGPSYDRLPLDDDDQEEQGIQQQQQQQQLQLQGNSSPPPPIPIHQLMNDPFGLAAAAAAAHHHHPGIPPQLPPPDILASWAAAAAAAGTRPPI